jgi:hypothetical protein
MLRDTFLGYVISTRRGIVRNETIILYTYCEGFRGASEHTVYYVFRPRFETCSLLDQISYI